MGIEDGPRVVAMEKSFRGRPCRRRERAARTWAMTLLTRNFMERVRLMVTSIVDHLILCPMSFNCGSVTDLWIWPEGPVGE